MSWSSNPTIETTSRATEDALTALMSAASERILLLDGAMGTQIQCLNLDETHFRGDRFHSCDRHLQGNNDLLTLTQPQAIEDIHFAYALAGADILETNTFSSTSIAQADYGMEDVVYELNRDGARLARRAAIKAEKADGRRRFVAGALGPTNRTASLSPDVNNPGFRAVSFDELRDRLWRADPRAHRRRRGHSPDRDHLRHAQRQGGDLRLLRGVRRARRSHAAHDLGHHHRPLGPHPLRPDADRVLAFGAPCAPLFHRSQLRAWRERDARAPGRDRRRGGHARVRLSQRRPAQRLRPI